MSPVVTLWVSCGVGCGASQACHMSPQTTARLPRSTDASSPDCGCHDTAVTAALREKYFFKLITITALNLNTYYVKYFSLSPVRNNLRIALLSTRRPFFYLFILYKVPTRKMARVLLCNVSKIHKAIFGNFYGNDYKIPEFKKAKQRGATWMIKIISNVSKLLIDADQETFGNFLVISHEP